MGRKSDEQETAGNGMMMENAATCRNQLTVVPAWAAESGAPPSLQLFAGFAGFFLTQMKEICHELRREDRTRSRRATGFRSITKSPTVCFWVYQCFSHKLWIVLFSSIAKPRKELNTSHFRSNHQQQVVKMMMRIATLRGIIRRHWGWSIFDLAKGGSVRRA